MQIVFNIQSYTSLPRQEEIVLHSTLLVLDEMSNTLWILFEYHIDYDWWKSPKMMLIYLFSCLDMEFLAKEFYS